MSDEEKKISTLAMTAEEIALIRESLISRRSAIVSQQAKQLSALGSADKHHIADLEEMSSDSADADQLCSIVDLGSSTIESIDSALGKIDSGSYGNCEDCGDPIARARLKYLPFAAVCVDCQRKREAMPRFDDDE